jgi:hypothetical protein
MKKHKTLIGYLNSLSPFQRECEMNIALSTMSDRSNRIQRLDSPTYRRQDWQEPLSRGQLCSDYAAARHIFKMIKQIEMATT